MAADQLVAAAMGWSVACTARGGAGFSHIANLPSAAVGMLVSESGRAHRHQ